jgi:hypothetical protein
VLLGYSGVGKDTLASLLEREFTGCSIIIIKFSCLTKQLVAKLWGVDPSLLENKQWRAATHYIVDGHPIKLTPMDLLSALYHGAPFSNLSLANIEVALASIKPGSFPVFTDIRRQLELDAVLRFWQPRIVWLSRPNVGPGPNDHELVELVRYCMKHDLEVVSIVNKNINTAFNKLTSCLYCPYEHTTIC